MLPRHRGDLLQLQDRLPVAGGLVPRQQGREQDGVVGDDDAGNQPAALVGDRDIEVGTPDQLLFAADLRDGRSDRSRLSAWEAASGESGEAFTR